MAMGACAAAADVPDDAPRPLRIAREDGTAEKDPSLPDVDSDRARLL